MDERRGVVKAKRTIYQGRIFGVSADRVLLPHGREVEMEVVRHPESVVLLPMPDPDHLILVRQYRYAIDGWVWELPAGSVDPGESPEQAAARESEEEIGLVPGRVDHIGHFYPTPGYCDEKMSFFRLTDLSEPAPESTAHKDEDEDLRVKTFGVEELRAMVRRMEMTDLKTAVGIFLV